MIHLNTLAPRKGEKKHTIRIGRGPASGSGKTSGYLHIKNIYLTGLITGMP